MFCFNAIRITTSNASVTSREYSAICTWQPQHQMPLTTRDTSYLSVPPDTDQFGQCLLHTSTRATISTCKSTASFSCPCGQSNVSLDSQMHHCTTTAIQPFVATSLQYLHCTHTSCCSLLNHMNHQNDPQNNVNHQNEALATELQRFRLLLLHGLHVAEPNGLALDILAFM